MNEGMLPAAADQIPPAAGSLLVVMVEDYRDVATMNTVALFRIGALPTVVQSGA